MPDDSDHRATGSGENAGWSSVYDHSKRYGFSDAQKRVLERVPDGSTVLELGPASGYMTEVIHGRGCTVDAIEVNAEDAAKAKRFCRRIVVGSAEDDACYAQLPGPYDVVLMVDVLEHLRRPDIALMNIRTRVKAGGQAFVCLPNIAYYRMRLDLVKGRFDYTDTGLLDRTHLRFFTKSTAIALFTAYGFYVDEIIVPEPRVPRLGGLKSWVKSRWPELFALQIVYRLRPP